MKYHYKRLLTFLDHIFPQLYICILSVQQRERERGQGRFARHSQRNLYMTVWLPMNFPPDGCECWEALGADFLNGFELISVLLFTFEYLANVWSANANIRRDS